MDNHSQDSDCACIEVELVRKITQENAIIEQGYKQYAQYKSEKSVQWLGPKKHTCQTKHMRFFPSSTLIGN
jgi:hypothetical protein